MNLEKILQERYDRESFISLTTNILQVEPSEPIKVKGESEKIEEIYLIGEKYIGSRSFCILEVKLKNTVLERSPVFQRDEVFKYLNGKGSDAALVAYYKEDETVWKIALVTITYFFDESGKIQVKPSEAKRFWYIVGEEKPTHTAQQQLSKLLNRENSYEEILNAFSIEPVTKAFYQEIADWYFWALKHVKFPKDAEEVPNGRNIAVIRFITRIMFIWFMKQKGLIKDELFEDKKIEDLLRDFSEQSTTYYKAILQNLFFATLNTPIDERDFRTEKRVNGFYNEDYMNHGKFRYQELFKNLEQLKSLFNYIPFLNGGLFECLDKKKNDPSNNTGKEIRIDGFSDVDLKQPVFPNFLFFSEEREVDLNEDYGTKNKKYLVRGIINILKSYNFTVEESSPVEQEVALDPELLGKVFENLLASYNPETATTARKATGSYYTPREIVNYMVDESLKEYFNTKTKGNIENFDEKLKNLFSYSSDANPFTETETDLLIQSIDSLKVIDPAVGSGAFPMSTLQRLVFLLSKLDPHNTKWKAQQVKAIEDNVKDPDLKNELIKEIEANFKDNELDYGRKLYLIQKCLYGVDIQPIAIQIAKLRFFISLLVDEKVNPDDRNNNYGIKPLPNLETKLVIANSLIGLNSHALTLPSQNIVKLEEEIQKKLSDYFSAYKKEEKEKIKREYRILVEKLKQSFENEGFPSSVTEKIIKYDPFDTNIASDWFDPEWMFGIKESFDIVIANPPYVNIEEIDLKLKPIYSQFSTAYQKYDLYILFFEKGIELLKNKGNLIFITSNKYFSQGYGLKLRQLFLKNQIAKIINFNYDVFKSSVVRTAIIQVVKQKVKPDTDIAIIDINTQKETDKFFNQQYNYIKQEIFEQTEENNFRINLTNEKIKILEKIRQNCLQVDKICSVNYGLRPSSEVLDLKKESFIYEKKKRPHFKKYFEGKDMGYWLVKNYRYLDYRPDVMYNPMFEELFENEKLVGLRTLSDIFKLRFIYDDQGSYCNDSVVVLTLWYKFEGVDYPTIKRTITKEKIETSKRFSYQYLQAILNSKMIKFYVNELLYDGTHFYPNHMKILPIKKIQKTDQQPLINLVDQILAKKKSNPDADTSSLESQIDRLVYKLYTLTDDEIKIIENEIE